MFNKILRESFSKKNCIYSNKDRFFFKHVMKSTFDQYKDRPKRHFMIFYKFIEDMHYKRIPYQEAHLKLIQNYEKDGNLLIGGRNLQIIFYKL